MSFPEPVQFNGAPGPEHDPGRSRNQPTKFRCLDCNWKGKGYIEMGDHYWPTLHKIVDEWHPRY